MAGCGTMGAFVFSVLYCVHTYVRRCVVVCAYVRAVCVWWCVGVYVGVGVGVMHVYAVCVWWCVGVYVGVGVCVMHVCVRVCLYVCASPVSVCVCVSVYLPMLVSTVCILPWPGVLSFCSAAVNTLLLPQCLCSARYMLCKALYAYRAPSAEATVHVACNQ